MSCAPPALHPEHTWLKTEDHSLAASPEEQHIAAHAAADSAHVKTTAFLWLAGAIIAEVLATLSLKAALEVPVLYAAVVTGYAAAFLCLTKALRRGLGLGIAYGIWGAAGVALTAAASSVLFAEELSLVSWAGIGLIAIGVVVVEVASSRALKRRAQEFLAESTDLEVEDDGTFWDTTVYPAEVGPVTESLPAALGPAVDADELTMPDEYEEWEDLLETDSSAPDGEPAENRREDTQ